MSHRPCINWNDTIGDDEPLPTWVQLFECERCECEFCSLCSIEPGDRRVLCAQCRSISEESMRRRLIAAPVNDLLAWPLHADDCETKGMPDCECLPCMKSECERVWMIDELIERRLLVPFEREGWRENRAWNHPRHLNRQQLINRDAAREKKWAADRARQLQDRRDCAARLWARRRLERAARQLEREALAAQRDAERQLVLW